MMRIDRVETEDDIRDIEDQQQEEEKRRLRDRPRKASRGHWDNPCDFFVSTLGYAVGLGNVWRFPFLAFQHGGGSFLVPYFLMLVFAGLPVFFLEIFLGQYSGVGPVKTFGRLLPILRGLGYAMVSVGLLFAYFYIVVVSWSIQYLFASIGLEWASCGNQYNTEDCFEIPDDEYGEDAVTSQGNVSSSVEEYWSRYVLGMQGRSWDNFGSPRLNSTITLLLSWILVSACLLKGVKSSGRVVYFTSFFPYVVLAALAVRGFTLPGAGEGIRYFITPNWRGLAKIGVWTDAATQVIFSLGPACGCVVTLSSYNRFDRNCHRDAVLVAVCNCATSVFCGLVVFSVLGFIAHEKGARINEVVEAGPGLAFVVYPEVVTRMSGSSLWSLLFFAMLISLALGSIFGAFETVVSALSDQFPLLREHKSKLVVSIATLMFLLGLPFTCGGGIHAFNLFNASAPSWNLLVFALFEVVGVAWVYGTDNVTSNLREMGIELASGTAFYWTVCWRIVTPAILFLLLLLSWANFGHVEYEGYVYPVWVQCLGFVITASTLFWIPVFAFVEVDKANERGFSITGPTSAWGRQGSCYSEPPSREHEETSFGVR